MTLKLQFDGLQKSDTVIKWNCGAIQALEFTATVVAFRAVDTVVEQVHNDATMGEWEDARISLRRNQLSGDVAPHVVAPPIPQD